MFVTATFPLQHYTVRSYVTIIYSILINQLKHYYVKMPLDVNECAGDHGCHHLCNNTDGSFHCYCNPGYMLHTNGTNCTGRS